MPTIEQLRADLAQARQGYDSAWQYADDYSVYCRGRDQAAEINALTARIALMERAAASLDERMGQPMAALDGLTVRVPA